MLLDGPLAFPPPYSGRLEVVRFEIMSEFDVSYIGAAGAGLLSFLSPCVLPLVPAYLCFLGGVSLEELVDAEAAGAERQLVTRRVALAALATRSK